MTDIEILKEIERKLARSPAMFLRYEEYTGYKRGVKAAITEFAKYLEEMDL